VTFLLRYATVHCLGHLLTHELIDPPLTTRDIGRQPLYAILAHGEGERGQCRRANSASNIRTPTSHYVYQYQYQYLPPRTQQERRQGRAQQCRPGERPRYHRVPAMSACGPWLLPRPPAPSNPGVAQTNLPRATHRGNGGPAGRLNGMLVRETWRLWICGVKQVSGRVSEFAGCRTRDGEGCAAEGTGW
jgi:hypothetical protein